MSVGSGGCWLGGETLTLAEAVLPLAASVDVTALVTLFCMPALMPETFTAKLQEPFAAMADAVSDTANSGGSRDDLLGAMGYRDALLRAAAATHLNAIFHTAADQDFLNASLAQADAAALDRASDPNADLSLQRVKEVARMLVEQEALRQLALLLDTGAPAEKWLAASKIASTICRALPSALFTTTCSTRLRPNCSSWALLESMMPSLTKTKTSPDSAWMVISSYVASGNMPGGRPVA